MTEALQAAIDAAPDDPAGYLAYGEWLRGQGDPRGELIALQHAGDTDAGTALLARHAELWGELATFVRPTWRWGFLQAASMKPQAPLALLAHPSARFLRKLTLAATELGPVIDMLSAHPHPTLSELAIGIVGGTATWSAQTSSALRRAAPSLTSFALRGRAIVVEELALGELRELSVSAAALSIPSVTAVVRSLTPHIERFTLEAGDAELNKSALAPLLVAKTVPALAHLGLGYSTVSDSIASWIAASKLITQLVSLDLSRGTLSDAGALALATTPSRMLMRLDVHDSFISRSGIGALAQAQARAKPRELALDIRGQRAEAGRPTLRAWT